MSEELIKKIGDGATEIVFCFDTTGSMSSCIGTVRKKVEQLCEQMFSDIKGLRVGIIAHGDYCDGENAINKLPLTDNWNDISNFIREAPNTMGGDEPECYELALRTAKDMGWSDDGKAGRVLLMIGDAPPHEADDSQNTDNIDWKTELRELKELGVSVYPLQCLYSKHRNAANQFWSAMSELSSTPLMRLDEFNESAEALEGFAYAAAGSKAFDTYETRLNATENVSKSMTARNSVLRKEAFKYDKLREE